MDARLTWYLPRLERMGGTVSCERLLASSSVEGGVLRSGV